MKEGFEKLGGAAAAGPPPGKLIPDPGKLGGGAAGAPPGKPVDAPVKLGVVSGAGTGSIGGNPSPLIPLLLVVPEPTELSSAKGSSDIEAKPPPPIGG